MIGKKRNIAQISAATDIGTVRKTNQDNLFLMKQVLDYSHLSHFSTADLCGIPILVAVCDGMGGGMMGEQASFIAVNRLAQLDLYEYPKMKDKDLIPVLRSLFFEINEMIYNGFGILGTLTGSTMTLLYIDNKRVVSANVGDTLCIKIDQNGYEIISRVDTVANMMYEQGTISEQERWTNSAKKQLSQCLGLNPASSTVEPFIYMEKRSRTNMTYMLCSDGITESIYPESIAEILKEEYQPNIARKIVECSLNMGTRDNATAVVVNI